MTPTDTGSVVGSHGFGTQFPTPSKTLQPEIQMTSERFHDALDALRHRTPFQPFTVELVSGNRFEVDYPEALVARDGVAVFLASGGVPTLFDHESVSQLIGDSRSEPVR